MDRRIVYRFACASGRSPVRAVPPLTSRFPQPRVSRWPPVVTRSVVLTTGSIRCGRGLIGAGNEEASQSAACVEVVNGMEVQLNEHGTAKDVLRAHRLRSRRFAFDRALDGNSAQEETYAASAAPLVEYVLQGRNATCFCYGATGTGKTYTMLGSNDQPGIMVLSLRDLFQHVATHPGVKVRGCPLSTVRRALSSRGSDASLCPT